MSHKIVEPRKMDIFSFIQEKLKINDVEPMYVAIVNSKLPLMTRQRICFGEGLADHLGCAARMSVYASYWRGVAWFIHQGIRGGARRHFRAKAAEDAVDYMRVEFSNLSTFFNKMPNSYYSARDYICSVPQFGAFSAFKIADMAERTCNCTVDFSKTGYSDLAKYPRRGLTLAAEYLKTKDEKGLLDSLLGYKWCRLAPPHRDRPMNLQEIETCLCNYGHSKWHPPGYETNELKKLLSGYGVLADKLAENLPKGR